MRQYKVSRRHFWIGLGVTAVLAVIAAVAVKPEGFTALGLGVSLGVSVSATVWFLRVLVRERDKG